MDAHDLSLEGLQADARWLAHRYDRTTNEIQFRYLSRAGHANIPFLTDEYLGDAPIAVADRGEVSRGQNSAPVHFIFHSAFCGSTMMARAFDLPGSAMGLSEPVILNDIMGIRNRGELNGEQIAGLLGDSMNLLGRPFGNNEAIIIKPSNIVNSIAAPILALRPSSKAVLLYAPLPDFLASVARKGMECRLWARQLLERWLPEVSTDFGLMPSDCFRLTDLQTAAVGWLVQHKIFAAMAMRFGFERVATLDSATLTSDAPKALAAAHRFYGLHGGEAAELAYASSAALKRHSKLGDEFLPGQRSEELDQAKSVFGDEIGMVSVWAERVAQAAGMKMELPNPLIS